MSDEANQAKLAAKGIAMPPIKPRRPLRLA